MYEFLEKLNQHNSKKIYTENNKKTIIQVWTHKCRNQTGYWGIGDMVRGTIFLFEYCKKNNYNFILDIQLHSLSKYLKHEPHQYSNVILKNKDNIIFVSPNNISYYTQNEVNFFFTNSFYNFISQDAKYFMRNALTPNDSFKDHLSNYLIQDDYSVLHYRLGDNYNGNVVKYLLHLKQHINVNTKQVFISDCKKLKELVKELIKENTTLLIIDIDPGHIGENINVQNDLIEYFILIHSKKIKTYSNYRSISGFVYSVNQVFDIDLINIKHVELK
jgi:hypothetical protein